METMIHPTAQVATSAIGAGTTIWQYVVVLAGARIGRRCNICSHVFIENDVILGDDVTIKCGVQLWDGIELEDRVFVGPNATFTNDPLPRSKHRCVPARTLVRAGASIGANATILCGLRIGTAAMIGAGSVVTRDVGEYELHYGNPARHRGYVTADGDVLDLAMRSSRDGTRYRISNGQMVRA
jgi:UDP-2-acetamido-3-amino-2,3-dideoxy-glucuronate N-acetyltransferase